ncbi:flavodoxin domain-containing protein [Nocardioides sp.]|uniref:flavodoxin domain-containing protein n=1 Tax=Nocardioides sp. TaxID=35761 RepID=UPI002ED53509
MTQRRASVIYESMFGNTAAVAEAVADALRAADITVDLVPVSAAPRAAALAVDVVLLGAPTHAFTLSRARTREDAVRQGAPADRAATGLREWLADARIHPPSAPIAAAVFDTRSGSVRHLPGSAARKAARLARGAGFRPVLGAHSSYVDGIDGPLLEGELDRARAWATELAAQVLPRHSTT